MKTWETTLMQFQTLSKYFSSFSYIIFSIFSVANLYTRKNRILRALVPSDSVIVWMRPGFS